MKSLSCASLHSFFFKINPFFWWLLVGVTMHDMVSSGVFFFEKYENKICLVFFEFHCTCQNINNEVFKTLEYVLKNIFRKRLYVSPKIRHYTYQHVLYLLVEKFFEIQNYVDRVNINSKNRLQQNIDTVVFIINCHVSYCFFEGVN